MDPRVAKLKPVEECENFAKNTSERGHPELAVQACERAIQLLAQSHGAKSSVERECLEAIYAVHVSVLHNIAALPIVSPGHEREGRLSGCRQLESLRKNRRRINYRKTGESCLQKRSESMGGNLARVRYG